VNRCDEMLTMRYPAFYLSPLLALVAAHKGKNSTTYQSLIDLEAQLSTTQGDMTFDDFKYALDISIDSLDHHRPYFLQALPYVSITSHGWLGMAALACPNLKASAQLLADFLPVITPYFSARKEENIFETTIYLEHTVDFGRKINMFLAELTIAIILDFGRYALTHHSNYSQPIIAKTYFKHHTLFSTHDYGHFFGAQPIFGEKQHKIIISNHIMNTNIQTYNKHTYEMLLAILQQQLNHFHQEKTIRYRVEHYIKDMIQKGHKVSIETACVDLAMSERTLRRRLNDESTSFSDILSDVRIQVAKTLLLTTPYSIEKIAMMVGFGNSSTFSRAFKQIEKISPSQFRIHINLQ
jgi:AraC-like DNA-binding protein